MGGTNQGERASGGLTPYAPLQLLKQARGQIEAPSFDHSRKRLLQCMRPVLAHRVDSLRVRRFGRDRSEADMPRASEAGRSDENDPERSMHGAFCCAAQPLLLPN